MADAAGKLVSMFKKQQRAAAAAGAGLQLRLLLSLPIFAILSKRELQVVPELLQVRPMQRKL